MLEVYIGEGPAILVVALLVVFESGALAFNQLLEAFAERISEDSTRGMGLSPETGLWSQWWVHGGPWPGC